MIPCILFEDEHLLVVNKPAGLNTHAPAPFAGEGLYDWLRHREPQWGNLAIIHRLDKETSGVIVFGKTALANRSLTDQFTRRIVRKKYVLLTERPVPARERDVKSKIIRAGDKYVSSPRGEPAETRFGVPASAGSVLAGCVKAVPAEPVTGRTHQIRVHAAESGFPILGDTLYGGTGFVRVCLHAAELSFRHPESGASMKFSAPADFVSDYPHAILRAALVDPAETNAFRLMHGASDDRPGWYVDRLGDFVLSQSAQPLSPDRQAHLIALETAGAYHKILDRQVRRADVHDASPRIVCGKGSPDRFVVRENGLKFEVSFNEGYSVGLFLDQRDNRRRLLTGHVAADFSLPDLVAGTPAAKIEVLNCFAYTCGFSVCAAKAGARTTSLDLSKKYLEWGQRNFRLNGLDPAKHGFIYGDAFDWLKRLAKQQRQFDIVLLDPPTFSRSKAQGIFQAQKDYARLVESALPLLRSGGVLFASTNAAGWAPERFVSELERTVRKARRRIVARHYAPQPPDFPVSRAEPAYLKTVWLRVEQEPATTEFRTASARRPIIVRGRSG